MCWRKCVLALMILAVGLGTRPTARAQDRSSTPDDGAIPRTFSSKSFLLHTDQTAEEAEALLKRLETMLGFVSRYWGRPHRGVITMYVAKDLSQWPRAVLAKMAPEGIASIQGGGGLTIGTIMVRGNEFRSKAVVYAVAKHGIPQHEAVHAYCNHAFGGTGPVWYAEGMAEVGNYWVEDEKGVSTPQHVIDYLKKNDPKPLDAIVNNPLETTGDSWQNYAWRWALCQLLGHNENYARRFKPLGLQLLNRKDIDFWQVYGSQAEEIDFEYRLFLNTIEPGYRVDLCSWDWKTRFTSPSSGRSMLSKIEAARGWQASRLIVTEDTEYEYAAEGEWNLEKDGDKVSADGADDGRGRLRGIILTDEGLGEPVDLGVHGSFVAPASGKLYLRCRDDWGAIADNAGKLSVRLKQKGSGRPLVAPAGDSSDGGSP